MKVCANPYARVKGLATDRLNNLDPFDPDDLFKERAVTPLGQDDGLLNSDSDSMMEDRYGNPQAKPKAIVYAYDAAAEREKERLKSAPVASVH